MKHFMSIYLTIVMVFAMCLPNAKVFADEAQAEAQEEQPAAEQVEPAQESGGANADEGIPQDEKSKSTTEQDAIKDSESRESADTAKENADENGNNSERVLTDKESELNLSEDESNDNVVQVTFSDSTIKTYTDFVEGWNAASASSGSTVKLLKDWVAQTDETYTTSFGFDTCGYIPIKNNITLDINGYTVDRALTKNVSGGEVLMEPGVAPIYKATILDSTFDGKTCGNGKITGGNGSGCISGNISINGVKISGNTTCEAPVLRLYSAATESPCVVTNSHICDNNEIGLSEYGFISTTGGGLCKLINTLITDNTLKSLACVTENGSDCILQDIVFKANKFMNSYNTGIFCAIDSIKNHLQADSVQLLNNEGLSTGFVFMTKGNKLSNIICEECDTGVSCLLSGSCTFGGSCKIKNVNLSEGATISQDSERPLTEDSEISISTAVIPTLTTPVCVSSDSALSYYSMVKSFKGEYIIRLDDSNKLELRSRVLENPAESNSYNFKVDESGYFDFEYKWYKPTIGDLPITDKTSGVVTSYYGISFGSYNNVMKTWSGTDLGGGVYLYFGISLQENEVIKLETTDNQKIYLYDLINDKTYAFSEESSGKYQIQAPKSDTLYIRADSDLTLSNVALANQTIEGDLVQSDSPQLHGSPEIDPGTLCFCDCIGTSVETNETFTIQSTVTVMPEYIRNKFDVTFDSNGGTTVSSITNVPYNTLISKPADPTYGLLYFEGWYTDIDCTLIHKWDFETDKVVSDMTLYANWVTSLTPAATDFTYTAPANLTYDGTAKVASLVAKSATEAEMGKLTIYYQAANADEWTTTAPTEVGTYAVSVSNAGGTKYEAASYITDDVWTFTVVKTDPAPDPTPTPDNNSGVSSAATSSDGTAQTGDNCSAILHGVAIISMLSVGCVSLARRKKVQPNK